MDIRNPKIEQISGCFEPTKVDIKLKVIKWCGDALEISQWKNYGIFKEQKCDASKKRHYTLLEVLRYPILFKGKI